MIEEVEAILREFDMENAPSPTSEAALAIAESVELDLLPKNNLIEYDSQLSP